MTDGRLPRRQVYIMMGILLITMAVIAGYLYIVTEDYEAWKTACDKEYGNWIPSKTLSENPQLNFFDKNNNSVSCIPGEATYVP